MIEDLRKTAVTLLKYTYNAILKDNYWPEQFETAQVILIPKSGIKESGFSAFGVGETVLTSRQNFEPLKKVYKAVRENFFRNFSEGGDQANRSVVV
ncbi:hypothetical protein WA026_009028 [Henosepilachna vigintioctopunctata]|uniref:Uncharacterized protein n=1 Tax=Henosepilachna vigintioctopunctata TaxID=420089 RepID=A0AAW1UQH1_9CUCU